MGEQSNPFELDSEDGNPETSQAISDQQDQTIEIDKNRWDIEKLQEDVGQEDVGYDDEGAYRKMNINGTATKIYTKYLTGTTDGDATTLVNHGVTDITKILSVASIIRNGVSGAYEAQDYRNTSSANDAFSVAYDSSNVIMFNVGANVQSQLYRIKVEYYL